LQAIIDEYENGQETTRATVEELQSTNEELRLTMEELETSKEELQSMNKELATVDQENRHKVEELSQLSSDLQNLLAATEIATLFLDRQLRILRYTPRVGELFNIRHTDHGRPLTDLTHRLGDHELHDDAIGVLENLQTVEREMESEDGRWYLARVLPYRAAEDRIDGVVMTFVDITTLKSANEALRKSEERYRLLMENVMEYAIIVLDTDGQVAKWNMGAERVFGYKEDEIVGRPGAIIFTREDQRRGAADKEMKEAMRTGQAYDERWHVRKDGSRFWASGVLTALYEANGRLRGFTKILRDVTERQAAEAARIHFQSLFESAPGLYIVLEPTRYEIVAVSNAFLTATITERDKITGRPIFDIFPDDPEDPTSDGVKQLLASFERVKAEGRADVVGVLRHPIPRPPEEGSGFEERFWSTINSPVFGPDGKLAYIIHRAEDVSPFINRMREEKREEEGHRLLESRAEQLEADILLRAQELQEANEQLRRLNETLEERVQERTRKVRELASQLTMAEQAERRRISQILHDNLQQLLYALHMKVNVIHNELASSGENGLREHAEQAFEWIDQAVSTTRRLTVDLSPPVLQGEGLVDALLWLVRQMDELHGLKVELEAEHGFHMPDEDMRVLLFQVVRELLVNVVKHAHTDRVTVDLTDQDESLVITVTDEGCGFDTAVVANGPSRKGGGLFNFRERLALFGGDMEVTSTKGHGTRVRVYVPVSR
jgi:PAS domain S-box-containing protein